KLSEFEDIKRVKKPIKASGFLFNNFN
ncbi:hypothetical protein LCGC14_2322920, partial [marine sediment metagenome]